MSNVSVQNDERFPLLLLLALTPFCVKYLIINDIAKLLLFGTAIAFNINKYRMHLVLNDLNYNPLLNREKRDENIVR